MKVFRLVITSQRLNKDLTQGKKKPWKMVSNWFLENAITINDLDYIKKFVEIISKHWNGETTWHLEYKETKMLVESEYYYTFEQMVARVKEYENYYPSK